MELNGKKKLHALSLAEKIQVLEMLDESKMSQSEVARRFQVSQPQISRICKNKEKLLADWCSGTANRERKRKRESKYSSIDEALLCWFHIARTKMWDVTGPMLLQKAKELADIMGQEFVPSIGWLVRWKRRNNVCFGQRHPTRAVHPLEPLCDKGPVPASLSLPQLLKDFAPENVFGCGEVVLLYKAMPGREQEVREQLCVVLCVNGSGTEKQKPVVVGRRLAPRCFFGVNTETLPVLYRSSANSQLTPELFSEWLTDFDREMGRQHRSVALVLDAERRCPNPEPANIRLVFLPPRPRHDDSPSPCPLHPDIVRDFKSRYKRRLLGKVFSIGSETDTSPASIASSITVLDALHMVAAAWDKVQPSLVERCFGEAGCSKGKGSFGPSRHPPPRGMSLEEFRRFVDMETELAYPPTLPPTGAYKEEEEEEEGEGEDLFGSLPTKADALKALGTLRRWFECNGSAEGVFRQFYSCEEEVERLCCQ
ncbi:tigger transposable element-derived protein 3 [Pelodiscus sinensis]|uniref:Tigger transposable element derived 3 n=1 Tax=Pelodiscus sinensis TaxID=13735 RepID=K7F1I3_PELSI|nr:tigger transposable element-derived protein 3 [Pelodiscus sinensis]|eukprot:XP_006131690.1 tigger transposable element-derived protein 3 [Pelodiscus sinensis]